MVNLTGCYMERERREIEAAVADYDDHCAEEIEMDRRRQEEIERAVRGDQWLEDIRAALREDTVEHLRFHTEEIGALLEFREGFQGNTEITTKINDLISLEISLVKTLREELNSNE